LAKYAAIVSGVRLLTCVAAITALVTLLAATGARADEFLAMPGLWRTTYEIDGGSVAKAGEPRVVWHCVDERADPWVAFAQLEELPGMTCRSTARKRTSTSLEWQAQCRGPGPDPVADLIDVSGEIAFDSAQHYHGRVRLSGRLMGYPVLTSTTVEGTRKAACTSPAD
jgi:hypothetical protein